MICDLTGKWDLSCSKKGFKTIPAQIPGDNASALLAAKLMPDPNIGFKEKEVQWIREYNWIWKKTVKLSADFMKQKRITLNIDSLDTVGTVYINGKKAVHSENMFVRIRQDVKQFLHAGINTIEIKVEPVEPLIAKTVKKYPSPPPFTNTGGQVNGLNRVRKIQCQGGWDWGINVMVSGMYGKVCLEGNDGVRIDHIYTAQKHTKDICLLTVTAEVDAAEAGKETFTFRFAGKKYEVTKQLKQGINIISAPIEVKKPKLWYPAGYGAQPLYDLEVSVSGASVKKRIGLRDLQVVSKKDKIGVSLFFRVNGIDVFAKGADWIPIDPLPQRYTRENYAKLLDAAIEANMNALRVWGGGLYEMDAFYELCDEKGILLWQDCMFACASYADDAEFLATITEEIVYQVKRLRDHASIALWCGDNECGGFLRWAPGRPECLPRILQYDRFNQAVGKAVKSADTTRIFWKTSPCNGDGELGGWDDDSKGDMHYWKVWHGGASFEDYYKVKPRFCSEFGYQAFPSLNTVRIYAEGNVPNVTSPLMEYHQRNNAGNSKIVEMFTRYFRFPSGMENFVYLSQVQQAMAIRSCVEFWRTLKPRCMGTIYWQLNDNWPVASWSSIDYYGNWKQLHYQAKRFYSPLAAVAIKQDNKVAIHVISDLLVPVKGQIQLQVVRMNGKVVKNVNIPVKLKPQEAILAATYSQEELKADPLQDFLFFELKAEADGKKYSFCNDFLFSKPKEYELPDAKVSAVISKKDDVWHLTLKTDLPAFYVFAEFTGIKAVFSNNSFTMLPGKTIDLTFRMEEKHSVKELQKALTVRHLRDSFEK